MKAEDTFETVPCETEFVGGTSSTMDCEHTKRSSHEDTIPTHACCDRITRVAQIGRYPDRPRLSSIDDCPCHEPKPPAVA